MSSDFETKVLFNGTISFRNREAAARFLELVGNVVENSVAVFHGKAPPTTLSNDLDGVEVSACVTGMCALVLLCSASDHNDSNQRLLHHFEDNVEDSSDGDLPLTRSVSASPSCCVSVCAVVRVRVHAIRLCLIEQCRLPLMRATKLGASSHCYASRWTTSSGFSWLSNSNHCLRIWSC